jgi:hypothetical protein
VGDGVAIVSIVGSAGPVPADVDQRVTEALVAGLQSPASFTGGRERAPESTSGSASPRG